MESYNHNYESYFCGDSYLFYVKFPIVIENRTDSDVAEILLAKPIPEEIQDEIFQSMIGKKFLILGDDKGSLFLDIKEVLPLGKDRLLLKGTKTYGQSITTTTGALGRR